MSRGSLSSRLIVAAVLVLAALAAVDSIRGGSPAAAPAPHLNAAAESSATQHPGGRRAIERIGAEWARHLASSGLADCYHTGEELCEQLHCVHAGGHKLPNCRMPTPAYRRSFRGAVVADVVIKDYEAVAMLSNGEPIELHAAGRTWWVLQLGRGAGRGFFEKPG